MRPKSSTVIVSPSFAPSRQIERRFAAHLNVCTEKSARVVEDQRADSQGDWLGLPLSRQPSTRFSDPSFPSRTTLFGRGRLIPFAFEHRQPGILRESRIRRRQLAQPKNRAPIRLNSAGMYAIRAKPHAPRLLVFRHIAENSTCRRLPVCARERTLAVGSGCANQENSAPVPARTGTLLDGTPSNAT